MIGRMTIWPSTTTGRSLIACIPVMRNGVSNGLNTTEQECDRDQRHMRRNGSVPQQMLIPKETASRKHGTVGAGKGAENGDDGVNEDSPRTAD